MPASDLDSSWMLAINDAVARGISVGKDAIFTFGPYASIYNKQYHPTTDTMMLIGSGWLGICYALALSFVVRKTMIVALALLFMTATFMFTRDTLINFYTLLFVLCCAELASKVVVLRSKLTTGLFLAVTSSTLGMVIGIKASFIALAFVAWGLGAGLFLLSGEIIFFAIVLCTPVATALLAWALAGQPIAGLADYLKNSVTISAGYTEAVSLTGDARDIVVYLCAAVMILFALTKTRFPAWGSKAAIALIFVLFFFVSFKAGFVRHDGHALVPATAIAVGALALLTIEATGFAWAGVAFGFTALLVIDYGYTLSMEELFVNNPVRPYQNAIAGIKKRLQGKLGEEFRTNLAQINSELPLPAVQGTSDIYTFALAYLLASNNTWKPRPVIQSYQAYGRLAIANAEHLRGKDAPDNIFFRVEDIDNHYPTLGDGPSWPEILARYTPTDLQNDTLVLNRRPEAEKEDPVRTLLKTQGARIGEPVFLPEANGPLYAEINLHRTMAATLFSAAFKSPITSIAVTLTDGSKRKYRLIGEMAEKGFLLSPLVENAEDMNLLFGGTSKLARKSVQSFTIEQEAGSGAANSSYQVSLYALQWKKTPPISPPTQAFSDQPPFREGSEVVKPCDGNIDEIKGLVSGSVTNVHDVFSVSGWASGDAKMGVVPRTVYLVLNGENGKTVYLLAKRMPRPDVAAAYGRAGMAGTGYSAHASMAELPGRFHLGIILDLETEIRACSNFGATIRSE